MVTTPLLTDGDKEETQKVSNVNATSQDVLGRHLFWGTTSEEEHEKMIKVSSEGEEPEEVLAFPEFFQSLCFVDAILEGNIPAKYPIRFTDTVALFYGSVDSSGRVFAASFKEANLPYVEVDIRVFSASE